MSPAHEKEGLLSTTTSVSSVKKPRPRSKSIEEYGSIAVAVVENEETHEPVLLHDLAGPLLLDEHTMERRDSLISLVSRATTMGELEAHDTGGCSTSDGQATIPSEVASMTKNLIGCGALSLCNGIALCANTPGAILAGNLWIIVLGGIFGYFCWLIGKICHLTGRSTYRGIWQETVGHQGSMAVSVFNGLKAALADLAYASILSDTSMALLQSMGLQVSRVACLWMVTLFLILPLCLMKNLNVLAPFSALGTSGIIVTALAMLVRYLDGSYLPGGRYYDDIDPSFRPQFGTTNHAWSTSILPFVCMTYEVGTNMELFLFLACKKRPDPQRIHRLHWNILGLCDALQCRPILHGVKRPQPAAVWNRCGLVLWYFCGGIHGHCKLWLLDLWRKLLGLYIEQLQSL
jgi:hypothetical protein